MHSPNGNATNSGIIELSSDSDLIAQFKQGDDTAFTAIVLKYQERIRRSARNMMGNEEEALDMAQDVFVKAYFNLKQFRGESSLYTWLYRILCNLCLSSFRRKKVISFVQIDSAETIVSPNSKPDDDYERKDIHMAVNQAMNKLPHRQKMVFMMRQIDGLKHVEIAQILGITEGAAKSSYFQAINKLRGLLKIYGESYGLRQG